MSEIDIVDIKLRVKCYLFVY